MNFIDFLMEYYVWILVVLVVAIITIIGFLADVRNKKRKKEKVIENNPVKEPRATPIENIVVPENIPELDINNANITSSPAVGQVAPSVVQPQVTPTIVEQKVQPEVEEPIYRSLSDQKPQFAPSSVQIPKEVIVNPIPITPTPITTPIVEPVIEQVVQPQVSTVAPEQQIQPQVVVPSTVDTPQVANMMGSTFVVGEQTITPVAPIVQPQVVPTVPEQQIQPQVVQPVLQPQQVVTPQEMNQNSIDNTPTMTIPVPNQGPTVPVTTTAEKIENEDLWKL